MKDRGVNKNPPWTFILFLDGRGRLHAAWDLAQRSQKRVMKKYRGCVESLDMILSLLLNIPKYHLKLLWSQTSCSCWVLHGFIRSFSSLFSLYCKIRCSRWLVGRLLQMRHLYRSVLKAQGAWNVCLCLVPQPVVIKCSILKCWCDPVYFNKGNTNNLPDQSHSLSPPFFQVNKLALLLKFLPTVTMVMMWPFSSQSISQRHVQYKLLFGSLHPDQCIIRPSEAQSTLQTLLSFFFAFFACETGLMQQQTEYSVETFPQGHGELTVNKSVHPSWSWLRCGTCRHGKR